MNSMVFKVSWRGAGGRAHLGAATMMALTLAAAVAAPARAAGRDEGLPQRNLLVEWRMSGQSQQQGSQTGVRTGQIIVDSRGGVVGRTSIGTESYQTESQTESVQQVRVLNGGKARLFVGKSQPYTVWQWAWSGAQPAQGVSTGGGGTLGVIGPQAGPGQAGGAGTSGSGAAGSAGNSPYGAPQVLAQTVWIDLGQGLNVHPRWAGGQAPVIVELEAQAWQPAQAGSMYGGQMEPDGQTRRIEVGSTLSVPLGQWAVVARSGGGSQRRQSGSLSTRDMDDSHDQQLEIRVTAP